MPGAIKWPRVFLCATLTWGTYFTACSSAPRVIAIPPVSESARAPVNRSTDYPEAVAAIHSILVRDMGFPAIEGTVTFYPNSIALESALRAELEKEFEIAEKQLPPKAREILRATKEENVTFAARQRAVTAVAVGMHRRILVNELTFSRQPWWEQIRILAHELTHTVEKALVDGRLISADLWLIEGFADWVAYKILEALDIASFTKSRAGIVDAITKARYYKTFPALTQLTRTSDWQTWGPTLGPEATYGQAFLAVELLIEQKGVAAMIEYFRLFGKLNNRERNFATAFGEPVAKFDEKFTEHLKALLGQ